jgi:7,8-dihydropterin-6-yl-methyl-4-(beta-D-ribofuranosyl)aminobenzene 5'-phosphate synthase
MRRCLSLALVLAFASLAAAAHGGRIAPGEGPPLVLTVLYDNYPFRPGLRTAWGFSCLVELGEEVILFDTGESARILLSNMRALVIGPGRIQKVVLSHIHGDHVGGLLGFLEENSAVTVYLPASFPEGFKYRVRRCGARVVEVIGALRELGVERVALCHCSGDLARRLFREAWGGGFHPVGVGWSFGLPSAP